MTQPLSSSRGLAIARAWDDRRIPIAAVFGAALVVLPIRQVTALIRPQFVWEEAAAFWAWTFVGEGLDTILRPWGGFVHVYPRAVHLLARLGPPELAPAVGVIALYMVVAFVAAFVASDRLASAIPSRAVRVAVAAFVVVLPGAGVSLASVLNAQWFFAIYLAALVVADTPRLARSADYVAATVAGLTGPAVMVVAPLFLLRPANRHRIRLGLVLAACAAVQAVAYLLSVRRPAADVEPVGAALTLLAHSTIGLVGVTFGLLIELIAPGLLAALAVALVAAALRIGRLPVARGSTVIVLVGLVLAVLGVVATGPAAMASPLSGTRYFLVLSVGLFAVGATALQAGRRTGLVIVGFAIFGLVGDLLIPAPPTSSWSQHARCIGGPTACVVPVYPTEWSVSWPGSTGQYVVPVGFDVWGYPRYEPER